MAKERDRSEQHNYGQTWHQPSIHIKGRPGGLAGGRRLFSHRRKHSRSRFKVCFSTWSRQVIAEVAFKENNIGVIQASQPHRHNCKKRLKLTKTHHNNEKNLSRREVCTPSSVLREVRKKAWAQGTQGGGITHIDSQRVQWAESLISYKSHSSGQSCNTGTEQKGERSWKLKWPTEHTNAAGANQKKAQNLRDPANQVRMYSQAEAHFSA